MPYFWVEELADYMAGTGDPPPRSRVNAYGEVGEFGRFPDIDMGRVQIEQHDGADVNNNRHITFAGRRNRVLAAFCRYLYRAPQHHSHWFTTSFSGDPKNKPVFVRDHRMTFREAFEALMGDEECAEQARDWLSKQPLRKSGINQQYFAIPEVPPTARASRQHPYLHDLALMIRWDLTEAISAAHGDHWYPGVDDGIEPVPDEHVELVIWGYQRELNRELRQGTDGKLLPAYPLDTLPFDIQRAFAERRRLRFQQWGISRENWEADSWSVFSVPDDDWRPPWVSE